MATWIIGHGIIQWLDWLFLDIGRISIDGRDFVGCFA